jgi:hypothetical protein
MYGGAKLLTVWGEIKGPMAQYAGTTYTTQQSPDILAYLPQQKWTTLREPAAHGYARTVGCIAGEIDAVKQGEFGGIQKQGRWRKIAISLIDPVAEVLSVNALLTTMTERSVLDSLSAFEGAVSALGCNATPSNQHRPHLNESRQVAIQYEFAKMDRLRVTAP